MTSRRELAATFEVGGPLNRVVTIDSDVAAWVERRQKQLPEVAARLARIKPDDICTIVYTSGTTGDPKGVELAHRCLVDISRAILKVFPLLESDSTLSFLPYSHVFERINGIFIGMLFGGQAWISSGGDNLAAALREVRPPGWWSVPRLTERSTAAAMAGCR